MDEVQDKNVDKTPEAQDIQSSPGLQATSDDQVKLWRSARDIENIDPEKADVAWTRWAEEVGYYKPHLFDRPPANKVASFLNTQWKNGK